MFYVYVISIGNHMMRARALLLVFEKFTPAYLFQIALEIVWLPIQIMKW